MLSRRAASAFNNHKPLSSTNNRLSLTATTLWPSHACHSTARPPGSRTGRHRVPRIRRPHPAAARRPRHSSAVRRERRCSDRRRPGGRARPGWVRGRRGHQSAASARTRDRGRLERDLEPRSMHRPGHGTLGSHTLARRTVGHRTPGDHPPCLRPFGHGSAPARPPGRRPLRHVLSLAPHPPPRQGHSRAACAPDWPGRAGGLGRGRAGSVDQHGHCSGPLRAVLERYETAR